jgi:outer membrane immunogenic protein
LARPIRSIAAIAITVAVPALAADLAPRYSKAAPIVAAPVMVYNWSGCYFGGNLGGGWAKNDLLRFGS